VMSWAEFLIVSHWPIGVAVKPNPAPFRIKWLVPPLLFPQGGILDLEFASCLLPAATGSKVTNAFSPIFFSSFGSSFLSFNQRHRRDDSSD
jgi:hypothetical protein